MRYEYAGDRAVFLLDNPKSTQPSKRYLSLAGLAISRPYADRLFDAVCRQTLGKSRGSQDLYVARFLRPLLAFFRHGPVPYPVTSADWQRVLVNFLRFFLIDQGHSSQSVRTRILQWRGVAMPAFAFWIDEDIIPRDVEVPRIDFRSEPCAASPPPLLGKPSSWTVERAEPLQKLLVDVGFGQTDSDYLGSIERDCQDKISALRTVCLNHWAAMRADHQTGHALAAKITPSDIDDCLREGRHRGRCPRNGRAAPLTSPAFADGHSWALAIARRLMSAGENLDCISVRGLRSSPFFGPRAFRDGPYYPALFTLSALPACAAGLMTKSTQFYRFLSILSGVDVAAACALLIMEHPQFTPSSLQNAQLLNVRGRFFLEATDGDHTVRFSIDKPRAGARKGAVLSPLAQGIVTYVLEVTAPIRAVMRRCGHKAWRYLFLGQQEGGRFGPFKAAISTYLTLDRFSLIRLYPELGEHGLTRGTLDFRRLRNTVGVLRWFATGSITEMSRSLGNTHQVALEHYLPPALVAGLEHPNCPTLPEYADHARRPRRRLPPGGDQLLDPGRAAAVHGAADPRPPGRDESHRD